MFRHTGAHARSDVAQKMLLTVRASLKSRLTFVPEHGLNWEGVLCVMRNFCKVYFAEFSLRNVPQITP